MATRTLTDWEWVALAADKDSSASPILTGVNVSADGLTAAATNRHVLHIAPNTTALGEGTYGANMAVIEGNYPNYRYVCPDVSEVLADGGEARDLDIASATAEASAAVAWSKSRKSTAGRYSSADMATVGIGPAHVSGAYLLGILKGCAPTAKTVRVITDGALKPLWFDLGYGRGAVLMPVRDSEGNRVFDAEAELLTTLANGSVMKVERRLSVVCKGKGDGMTEARLLGIYVNCDDAVCVNCMTSAHHLALDNPSDDGEITPDNPAPIFSDSESDSPTWCSVSGCVALIPHALTSDGFTYLRAVDWRGDLREDLADAYGSVLDWTP